MSTFREQLLQRLQQLGDHFLTQRLVAVRTQKLVSNRHKQQVSTLLDCYNSFCQSPRFPQAQDPRLAELQDLEDSITADNQDWLMAEISFCDWLLGDLPASGPPMSAPRMAADSSPSLPAPLNQRMLEATSGLRKAIDKTRSRLLTSGDRYDSAAYRSARNAFTLTREAYDTQLYHNHVSATLEDVVRVEGPLREQLLAADGASFPQVIEAAADFLKTRIFATA